MADEYKVRSTSNVSAAVEDRELSCSTTTRRILRPELVDNPKNADACVKISIVHQRKKPKDGWEDVETESLNSLKAGEIRKLNLDTAETLSLFTELKNLFAIKQEKGVPYGERDIVVGYEGEIIKADPKRAKVIQELLNQGHSEQVWTELVKHKPDLANKLCLLRMHQNRVEALKEFEAGMKEEKAEAFWQDFFERNTWIFGFGLNYRFLRQVQSQPSYGGTNVSGSGAQRGDFLAATEAEVRFTVLVEVKKSNTALLGPEYRNGAFPPSQELAGGVAQVQTNCRKWETEGSQSDENREILGADNINSVQPKGILIIGNTNQLNSSAKKSSFEIFRRNLANPEVITFDELYERAKYFVEHPKDEIE